MNGRSHQSNCDLVRYLDRSINPRLIVKAEINLIIRLVGEINLLIRPKILMGLKWDLVRYLDSP